MSKMKTYLLLTCLSISTLMCAQNSEKSLPYKQLPEYSKEFTAGTVAARQIDGLGFRFYWATEGLTAKDLVYKPTETSRSTGKTVEHIYNLSVFILNTTLKNKPIKIETSNFAFSDFRKQTLLNLKQAADILRVSDDISEFIIKTKTSEYPFWNMINGPIADATWHCGQIASFRRITGNPINKNINHFTGIVKE